MRRALAILKYVPAVLCGLLVVAWVVSLLLAFGVVFPLPSEVTQKGSIKVAFHQGSLVFWRDQYGEESLQIALGPLQLSSTAWTGKFAFHGQSRRGINYLFCPVPVLLTILVPAAVGCLTRFRFPLWTYFAWTALLAAELAYYLR